MQSLTSQCRMHLNTLHPHSPLFKPSLYPSKLTTITSSSHPIHAASVKQLTTELSRATAPMAMPYQSHAQYPQQTHQRYEGGTKQLLPSKGPSTGQILAVVTLLPVIGTLLGLAGITLVGTFIGLAVATPLFVIFSPILIPTVLLLAGTVTALLTSGAFGLTGLSSISWVVNSFRQVTGSEPMDYAKRKMQEAAVGAGEKTNQTGEMIKSKAQTEGAAATTGRT